mmetsp:Transcript_16874/g.35425  ORF Transcript_16874/g.35425 Transcript_16874/m.35425 type:complete len:324 (-) Transcript_16874:252-1223(-)
MMPTLDDILRQRWRSAVEILAHEIFAQTNSCADANFYDEVAESISPLSQKWLEIVTTLYSEPHRAYHNMTHVQDVFNSLDFLLEDCYNYESSSTQQFSYHSQKSVDYAIMTLAAFFHDVIYDPKSATNEKDSSELFLKFASELECLIYSSFEGVLGNHDHCKQDHNVKRKVAMVTRVEECIIATATHTKSSAIAYESGDRLMATFLDADMSVLGKKEELYDLYAEAIRKEYGFVEREIYCSKRANILASFLPLSESETDSAESGERISTSEEGRLGKVVVSAETKRRAYIFATEKGREMWEDSALKNLTREIQMLRRSEIPYE